MQKKCNVMVETFHLRVREIIPASEIFTHSGSGSSVQPVYTIAEAHQLLNCVEGFLCSELRVQCTVSTIQHCMCSYPRIKLLHRINFGILP